MTAGSKKRALVFFFKNVHVPILLPLYREMARRGTYDAAFCLHPYDRTIRAGFPPEEEKAFREMAKGVRFVNHPQEWDADVSFMADNVAPILRGRGKIVNVGHGLLSKGQYFTDRDIINRENDSDLLCVPGPYHLERLTSSGKLKIPVVATGFPKLDTLFAPDRASRNQLMASAGLDPSKRVILYAPTFNMELSAIPFLWKRVAQLADENTYLLIKLHGSTQPEFKQMHRELPAVNPNVFYVEDQDITPYLQVADLMVSDVSSAFMEFIALDKPVVLFNNPNTPTYQNYDPRDIEYAWRDKVGVQVSSFEELCDAVREGLLHPEAGEEGRRYCAEQLFADRTGKASAYVLNAVEELLAGRNPGVAEVEELPQNAGSMDLRELDRVIGSVLESRRVGDLETARSRLASALQQFPGNSELSAIALQLGVA